MIIVKHKQKASQESAERQDTHKNYLFIFLISVFLPSSGYITENSPLDTSTRTAHRISLVIVIVKFSCTHRNDMEAN